MKTALVLVSSLYVTSVLSLEPIPFQVRELTNTSILTTGVESRIYGGLEAAEGQFKFMIFTLMKLPVGILQCSASLISPNWVLLAAHCVDFKDLQASNIILVGGKSKLLDYVRERKNLHFDIPIDEKTLGVQERRAKKFFIHPKYDNVNLGHDVALIQLEKPFDENSVTTIPISKDKMKNEKTCTILGWGLTRGNIQNYKLNFVYGKNVITTELGCLEKPKGPFICLRPDNRGICQGDSGSPLVCDGTVWGVASHFVSYQQNPDCGDSVEEYYSELHPNLRWLESTMAGSGYKLTVTSFGHLLACAFFVVRLSTKM